MHKSPRCRSLLVFAVLLSGWGEGAEIHRLNAMPAMEATQAAAADGDFIYAVSSTSVGKYNRKTAQRVGVSKGEAEHLNSAFHWEGKLYCAHSNFPRKPERSEIRVLDVGTLEITTFKNFGSSEGSLTWAVREGDAWWCNFAYYDAENARTRLVKYGEDWRVIQSWTYPDEVIRELGAYSISGGVWREGTLWVTGHDRRVVYRLRVPAEGKVLILEEVVPSPFPGQGIALDSENERGFIGIDRARKEVVIGELRE